MTNQLSTEDDMTELHVPNAAFMAAAEVNAADDATIEEILDAAAPLIVAAELERMADTPFEDGPWWALATSLRERAAELRGESQ